MRWGVRFFKNECNEGDRKFLLEMGESQEWGGVVLKWGNGKFSTFLYIEVVNSTIF